MKTNIEKYKTQLLQLANRFKDVRFSGQVAFAIIVLLITWSGIKAIQENYTLEKQIAAYKQQNSIQNLENENQQLQNSYYQSAQYLDISARQNFGLANPGEKELLVPQSVALRYTIPPPKAINTVASLPQPSIPESNFQSWVNFFLHRQSD